LSRLIQNGYLDAKKATLRAEPLEWRAIMPTDARFDAQMTGREPASYLPGGRVAMTAWSAGRKGAAAPRG
jgi:hypothetical protein